ncbi:MAG: glycosyltransferase family 4 protein [archaeon]
MKPERVLLISDFAFPVKAGTERLVFGAAEWLNKRGIKTDILTPNWDNLKEEETVKGLTIYRFNTHKIEKTKPLQRIRDYVNAGKTLGKYDVYHGFYTMPPLIATIDLAKKMKSKSVITFFGREQMEKNFPNPIKKLFLLNKLKKADKITTYTWNLEHYLKEKYFKEKNITTLQGWAENRFKEKKYEKPSKKIILFVGRIDESKGIFVLLEAFAKIKKRGQAKLVFIGPPHEKDKLEQKIKELKMDEFVEVKGFISDKELNKWYCLSEVVVVPALHGDAFGLSLMEAVAIGKPVICTDGVGSSSNEKEEIIIVKRNDSEELSGLLEKILTDKKFRETAAKISEKIAHLFNKDKVMKKYVEVYQKLL